MRHPVDARFQEFGPARAALGGIVFMHMIRKCLFNMAGRDGMSFADPFYGLAGQVHAQ